MQELIISYPRGMNGYFRIREDISTPGKLVQSISGQSHMIRTDNETGRLYVQARVEYSEYVGKIHAHLTCDPWLIQAPDGIVPLTGYWRICFRRQQGDWRIQDESGGDVTYVDTYEGVINHDWYDETPHLYHIGEFYHYDGKALLLPRISTRPTSVQSDIDRISNAYYGTESTGALVHGG